MNALNFLEKYKKIFWLFFLLIIALLTFYDLYKFDVYGKIILFYDKKYNCAGEGEQIVIPTGEKQVCCNGLSPVSLYHVNSEPHEIVIPDGLRIYKCVR